MNPPSPREFHTRSPITKVSYGKGAAPFRLRRKNGAKWDRETITVAPRSAYLMTGPARHEWEHSIPPVSEHRYSITLRTLRSAAARGRISNEA